ncbi:MAG: hypothetical protein ACO20A_01360 [Candidatus Nanopelagicales bacterium]
MDPQEVLSGLDDEQRAVAAHSSGRLDNDLSRCRPRRRRLDL